MPADDPQSVIDAIEEDLEYDLDSGVFRWKRAWSWSRPAGTQAGTPRQGYRVIRIRGTGYLAHRLVWLMAHGEWPEDEIDHINGERDDNRLANLRIATRLENTWNQTRLRLNNTSGVIGVGWSEHHGKWGARIRFRGRLLHLGFFGTIEEATEVRRAAEIEHFGAFAPDRGNIMKKKKPSRKKRAPVGRPPRGQKAALERIEIRCTQKEKDDIAEMAEFSDTTVSELVRDLLFGDYVPLQMPAREARALARQAKKAGMTLSDYIRDRLNLSTQVGA